MVILNWNNVNVIQTPSFSLTCYPNFISFAFILTLMTKRVSDQIFQLRNMYTYGEICIHLELLLVLAVPSLFAPLEIGCLFLRSTGTR